jgi:alkane 1-monooxygenase
MAFTGQTETGQPVSYVDGKRYLYFMSVFWPTIPTLSVIAYYTTGGNVLTTLIPVLFIFGLVPLVDAIIGEDLNNPPEEVVNDMANDQFYRILVMSTVPLFWISFISTAWMVGTENLPWWSILALVIGVGTTNGSCLTTGHELGHKHPAWERWLARVVLAPVAYGHFYVEHNRGHHRRVASFEDPASSRLGESFWAFLPRTVLGSLRSAWHLERGRLAY